MTLLLCNIVTAQERSAPAIPYPTRLVKLIVTGAVGSGTDIATRILAEHLGTRLGQSVAVENRVGAGGNIGSAAAAHAAADGYTLFMGSIATLALNEHMYAEIGYDPDRDFEPVIFTGSFPMVIAAHPSSPYKNLGHLVAAAKAKPGLVEIIYANSTARITLELLQQLTGIKLFAVPYNSLPPALTAVLGNQVPLIIETVTGVRSLVQTGRLQGLAVTSARSSELLPGVPSAIEQGVPDFEITAWNVLVVPKGVPPAVKARLFAEVQNALRDPTYRARVLQAGFEPSPADGIGKTPLEYIRTERARWGTLIKTYGIKP